MEIFINIYIFLIIRIIMIIKWKNKKIKNIRKIRGIVKNWKIELKFGRQKYN